MSLTNGDTEDGDTPEDVTDVVDLSIDSVSDEESVSERRTLQRIQSLWDEVAEMRMALARDRLAGEFTPKQRRQAYYESVRNLWIGLKPHLGRADPGVEEHYLLAIDLGDVTLTPPDPVQPTDTYTFGDGLELLAGEDWPEPVEYSFEGFVDFEEADVVLPAQWRVHLDVDSFNTTNYQQELVNRIQRSTPQSEDVSYRVHRPDSEDFESPFIIEQSRLLPEWVIERAFQALVELMGELGMSAAHEGDTDAKSDYSDVVDVDRNFGE